MPGLPAGTSAEFAARCIPGSWAVCAPQSPCCLYQRVDNFASHLHEASGSVYLAVSWSCSPTRGALSLSYACGSTCTKRVPQRWTWRLLSLGRWTWCIKGGPLSEAGVLRLRPSGPVGRPVSSIPAGASRSSKSPTAA